MTRYRDSFKNGESKKIDLDNSKNRLLSTKTESDFLLEAESERFVKAYYKYKSRYIPEIDYKDPKTFAFFGSAEKYYEDSINNIYSSYPYDGSKAEKMEWALSASYLDIYLLEHEYPKEVGSIDFVRSSITNSTGYVTVQTPKYIKFFGGPQKNTIYNASKNRESNIKIDGTTGNTIEFWLKKDAASYLATDKREVILDINSSNTSTSSNNFGRLTVELRSHANKANLSPFYLTYRSGSVGTTLPASSATAYGVRLGTSGKVTSNSVADGKWHHYAITAKTVGNNTVYKFYVDGKLDSTTTESYKIGPVTTFLSGTIGASTRNGASPNLGRGQLSGSLDELRIWKTARSEKQIGRFWYSPVHGGTDNDHTNADLGIYYKFNEGITSKAANDKVVLDYSGRINNGEIINWDSSMRSSSSAITLSEYKPEKDHQEIGDPVINPENTKIVNLKDDLKQRGRSYDASNLSSLRNSVPQYFTDTDTTLFIDLLQIMSSAFDDIFIKIKNLPKIKGFAHQEFFSEKGSYKKERDSRFLMGCEDISVEEFTGHHAKPWVSSILEHFGMVSADIFQDATMFERFFNRTEEVTFEHDLEEVKRLILSNIHKNLIHILKTKGTESSFRNLIRCFGVDDEIVKLNAYGENEVYELITKPVYTTVKQKSLSFEGQNYQGVLFPKPEAGDATARGYITGSSTPTPLTMEGNFIFPKYNLNTSVAMINSSLFGVHSVKDDADTTGTLTFRMDTAATATGFIDVVMAQDDIFNNRTFALEDSDGTTKTFLFDTTNTEGATGTVDSSGNIIIQISGNEFGEKSIITTQIRNAVNGVSDLDITATLTDGQYGDTDGKVLFTQGTAGLAGNTTIVHGTQIESGTTIQSFQGGNDGASADFSSLQVKAVKRKFDSPEAYFELSSSTGIINAISSSYFPNVYDNQHWNIAVRVGTKDGIDFNIAAPSQYFIELCGYNYDLDVLQNSFNVSASISASAYNKISQQNKAIFVGSHRTNFSGSVLMPSDVRVLGFNAWKDILTTDELKEHAQNSRVFGRKKPQSISNFDTGGNILSLDSMLWRWQFEAHSSSSSGGEMIIQDMSATSAGYSTSEKYTGKAIGLVNSSTAISQEFLPGVEYFGPDSAYSSDRVKIKNSEMEKFKADSRPVTYNFAFEKSMYQVISREMVNFFAGIVGFSNLIGEPVNKYRRKYKLLEKIRNRFFLRVNNEPDVEKFTEYYKWIDSSITTFLSQLIPASSFLSGDIRDVVESHVLERNKYEHKAPTMEFKDPADRTFSILGVNELLYDWEHGHAPNVFTERVNSKAIKFLVHGDTIDIPDSDNLSFTNSGNDLPFSISAWIYVDDIVNDSGVIISRRNSNIGTHGEGEWILQHQKGKLQMIIYANPAKNGIGNFSTMNRLFFTNTSNKITSKNWHFITVTYDGSKNASGLKVYKDATEITNQATGVTPAKNNYNGMPNFNLVTTIGGTDQPTTNTFEDFLADIVVYNKELTSAEVTEVYNSGKVKDMSVFSAYNNIISWWKMGDDYDDVGPGKIIDYKGTNHGTMVGRTSIVDSDGLDSDMVTQTRPWRESRDDSTNCLWVNERAEVNDDRKDIKRIIHTEIDGSTYVTRRLAKPYRLTADNVVNKKAGFNRDANKNTELYKVINEGMPIVLKKDGLTIQPPCKDIIDPNKKKMFAGKTDVTGTDGYLDGDSDLILPFNLVSSSAGTDLPGLMPGLKIANNHQELEITGEVSLKGPFGETHIGGMPHNKVHFGTIDPPAVAVVTIGNYAAMSAGNKISFTLIDGTTITATAASTTTSTDIDNPTFKIETSNTVTAANLASCLNANTKISTAHSHGIRVTITVKQALHGKPVTSNTNFMTTTNFSAEPTRPEAYLISGRESETLTISSPPISTPKSMFYRDVSATRFATIRNIKHTTSSLVLGNYGKDYETVMTAGRSNNNNYFIDNEGSFTDSSKYKVDSNLPGLTSFEVPDRGKTEHVIVNRFSSPGSPESSGMFTMDAESAEYSVYNTMNYRNLVVRSTLNRLHAERSDQFGLRSGSLTQGSIHKTNRNATRSPNQPGNGIYGIYSKSALKFAGKDLDELNADPSGHEHMVINQLMNNISATNFGIKNSDMSFFVWIKVRPTHTFSEADVTYPSSQANGGAGSGKSRWHSILSITSPTAANGSDRTRLNRLQNALFFGVSGYPSLIDGDGSTAIPSGHLVLDASSEEISHDWIDSGTKIDDDKWHHVGFTYDLSADSFKIYVDNILVAQKTYGASGSNRWNNSSPAMVAQIAAALYKRVDETTSFYNNFIHATFSNMTFWTQILSTGQVSELYNNGIPDNPNNHSAAASPSKLRTWHKLDRTDNLEDLSNHTGTTASDLDASTFGIDATNYVDTKTALAVLNEESEFDSVFIQRPIPSNDFGYSWIAASSNDNVHSFLRKNENFPYQHTMSPLAGTLKSEQAISFVEASELQPDLGFYNNNLHASNTLDTTNNIVSYTNTPLNSQVLNIQGPYGWPTWKQIRGYEHPVSRYERLNSKLSIVVGKLSIVSQTITPFPPTFQEYEWSTNPNLANLPERSNPDGLGIEKLIEVYSEVPATNRFNPITITFHGTAAQEMNADPISQVQAESYWTNDETSLAALGSASLIGGVFRTNLSGRLASLKATVGNEETKFSNYYLMDRLNIDDVRVPTSVQKILEELGTEPLSEDVLTTEINYIETLYPREANTFTKESRIREKFDFFSWRDLRTNRSLILTGSIANSVRSETDLGLLASQEGVSFQFDGSSGFVNVPHHADLSPVGPKITQMPTRKFTGFQARATANDSDDLTFAGLTNTNVAVQKFDAVSEHFQVADSDHLSFSEATNSNVTVKSFSGAGQSPKVFESVFAADHPDLSFVAQSSPRPVPVLTTLNGSSHKIVLNDSANSSFTEEVTLRSTTRSPKFSSSATKALQSNDNDEYSYSEPGASVNTSVVSFGQMGSTSHTGIMTVDPRTTGGPINELSMVQTDAASFESDFTIAFWIRPSDVTSYGGLTGTARKGILTKRGNGDQLGVGSTQTMYHSNNYEWMVTQRNKTINLYTKCDETGTQVYYPPGVDILDNANEWVHVAITYNRPIRSAAQADQTLVIDAGSNWLNNFHTEFVRMRLNLHTSDYVKITWDTSTEISGFSNTGASGNFKGTLTVGIKQSGWTQGTATAADANNSIAERTFNALTNHFGGSATFDDTLSFSRSNAVITCTMTTLGPIQGIPGNLGSSIFYHSSDDGAISTISNAHSLGTLNDGQFRTVKYYKNGELVATVNTPTLIVSSKYKYRRMSAATAEVDGVKPQLIMGHNANTNDSNGSWVGQLSNVCLWKNDGDSRSVGSNVYLADEGPLSDFSVRRLYNHGHPFDYMTHERWRDIVAYYRLTTNFTTNSESEDGPGFASNARRASGDTLVTSGTLSGDSALYTRERVLKSFVIAFWIRPDAVNPTGVYRGILSKQEEWFVYQSGKKIGLRLWDSSRKNRQNTDFNYLQTESGDILTNMSVWKHVAWHVYMTTSPNVLHVKLYVNGVEQFDREYAAEASAPAGFTMSGTGFNNFAPPNYGTPLRIGTPDHNTPDGSDFPGNGRTDTFGRQTAKSFIGVISNLLIFTGDRTDEWESSLFSQLYQVPGISIPSGTDGHLYDYRRHSKAGTLVGYWPLENTTQNNTEENLVSTTQAKIKITTNSASDFDGNQSVTLTSADGTERTYQFMNGGPYFNGDSISGTIVRVNVNGTSTHGDIADKLRLAINNSTNGHGTVKLDVTLETDTNTNDTVVIKQIFAGPDGKRAIPAPVGADASKFTVNGGVSSTSFTTNTDFNSVSGMVPAISTANSRLPKKDFQDVDFSIAFWIKGTGAGVIICKEDMDNSGSNTREWKISRTSSNRIDLVVFDSDPITSNDLTGGTAFKMRKYTTFSSLPNAGTRWNHVAIVYDASSGTATIYFNGSSVSLADNKAGTNMLYPSEYVSMRDTATPIHMFCEKNGASTQSHLAGSVRDFLIWRGTKLTAADVAGGTGVPTGLYNNGNYWNVRQHPKYNDALAYFKLDTNSPQDLKGNLTVNNHSLPSVSTPGSSNSSTLDIVQDEDVSFTIAFWYKKDSVSSTGRILGKWGTDTSTREYIVNQNGRGIELRLRDNTGTNNAAFESVFSSSTDILANATNVWEQIVIAYNAITRKADFYVNAARDGTGFTGTNSADYFEMQDTAVAFRLGSTFNTPSSAIDAADFDISNLLMFKHTDVAGVRQEPLSSAQVIELYNSGKIYNYKTHSRSIDIILWWKLDDAAGTTVADSFSTMTGTANTSLAQTNSSPALQKTTRSDLPFTITFWAKQSATTASRAIISKADIFDSDGLSPGEAVGEWAVTQGANGTVLLEIYDPKGPSNTPVKARWSWTSILSTSAWKFVTIVYDPSASSLATRATLYHGQHTVNSLSSATPTYLGSNDYVASSPTAYVTRIGNSPQNQSGHTADAGFPGFLSNMALYKVALNNTQITEIFNTGYPQDLRALATYTNAAAYWRLDEASGAAVDFKNALNGTRTGVTQQPASSSGLAKREMKDVPFSIGMWVQKLSFSGTDFLISKAGSGSTNDEYFLSIDTNGHVELVLHDTAAPNFGSVATGILKVENVFHTTNDKDKWVHLCVTYDPSSTTMTVYKDGSRVDSDNTITGAFYSEMSNTAGKFAIGSPDGKNLRTANALLSHVVVFKDCNLSNAEVSELYNNNYTYDYNTHSQSSKIVAWWKLNETATTGTVTFADSSTKSHTATASANIAALASPADYGAPEVLENYVFMTKPITIAVWIRPERLTGSQILVAKYGGSSANQKDFSFFMTGKSLRLDIYDKDTTTAIFQTGTEVITETNRWYHVAVTYTPDTGQTDGGNVVFYVDGTAHSDNTGNTTDFDHPITAGAAAPLRFGGNQGFFGGQYFKGNMSNVLLWIHPVDGQVLTGANIATIKNLGQLFCGSGVSDIPAFAEATGYWRMNENDSAFGIVKNLKNPTQFGSSFGGISQVAIPSADKFGYFYKTTQADKFNYTKSNGFGIDIVDVDSASTTTADPIFITSSRWPLDARAEFDKLPINLDESSFNNSSDGESCFSYLETSHATRGEGILQNDYSIFGAGANFQHGTPPVAPVYSRRIPQTYLNNQYLAGEAEWRAGTQLGVNPFDTDFEAHAENFRQIGQDHSLVPEFIISDHVEDVILNANGDFTEISNRDSFLSVTGAVYDASSGNLSVNSTFYKTYGISDMMKYFGVTLEEVEDNDLGDPLKITLRCKAAIKFTPYRGFYPVERVQQITEMFSRGYMSEFDFDTTETKPVNVVDQETLLKTKIRANMQQCIKPLFAPGILMNSIKTGMAVDYPLFTAENATVQFTSGSNNEGYKTLVISDPVAVRISPSSKAASGDYFAVADTRQPNPNQGRVYVYKKSLSQTTGVQEFSQVQTITAPAALDNERFGQSISMDGNFMAVGNLIHAVALQDGNSTFDQIDKNTAGGTLVNYSGSIYVYERTGDTFGSVLSSIRNPDDPRKRCANIDSDAAGNCTNIQATDVIENDGFGRRVLIKDDLIFTAASRTLKNSTITNCVYVYKAGFQGSSLGSTDVDGFKNIDGTRDVFQRVTSSVADSGVQSNFAHDYRNNSRLFDYSSNTLVVSAPNNAQFSSDDGQVFIFTINPATGKFAENQTLTPPNGYVQGLGSDFGRAISLSSDASILAIGQPGFTVSTASGTRKKNGVVHIFENSSSGYSYKQTLSMPTPSDTATGDLFGSSIDMDGSYMVVSAARANDNREFVFKEDSSGTWNFLTEILKDISVENRDRSNGGGLIGGDSIIHDGKIFAGSLQFNRGSTFDETKALIFVSDIIDDAVDNYDTIKRQIISPSKQFNRALENINNFTGSLVNNTKDSGIPRLKGNVYKRITFEEMLNPDFLEGTIIEDQEPHPSASIYYADKYSGKVMDFPFKFGELDSTNNEIDLGVSSFSLKKSLSESLKPYRLAINNFCAETINFFLEDGRTATLESQENVFPLLESGEAYKMRIEIINSNTRMYDRHSAFGPPVDEGQLKLLSDREFKVFEDQHAFSPFVPPFLDVGARPYVDITFTPSVTRNYTLDEIIDGSKYEYRNFSSIPENSSQNSNFVNAMSISASLKLDSFVVYEPTANDAGSTIEQRSRWVIQPKWETPVLNFIESTGSALKLNDSTSNNVDSNISGRISPWQKRNWRNFYVSKPKASTTPYLTSSVGMWHQAGKIPKSDKEGYTIRIAPHPEVTRARNQLADAVGFTNKNALSAQVGRLRKRKVVYEAVVAIPFIEPENSNQNITYFELDETHYAAALGLNRSMKDRLERALDGLETTSGQYRTAVEEYERLYNVPGQRPDEVIAYQLRMQDKYVIPEEFKNKMMYVFQFSAEFTRNDLSNIWQNVMPTSDFSGKDLRYSTVDNSQGISGQSQDIQYVSNFLNTLSPTSRAMDFKNNKIRWIVLKVKQRAEIDLNKVKRNSLQGPVSLDRLKIDNSRGTFSGTPELRNQKYSFNWPYDFFSIVELVKLEGKVDIFDTVPTLTDSSPTGEE